MHGKIYKERNVIRMPFFLLKFDRLFFLKGNAVLPEGYLRNYSSFLGEAAKKFFFVVGPLRGRGVDP